MLSIIKREQTHYILKFYTEYDYASIPSSQSCAASIRILQTGRPRDNSISDSLFGNSFTSLQVLNNIDVENNIQIIVQQKQNKFCIPNIYRKLIYNKLCNMIHKNKISYLDYHF